MPCRALLASSLFAVVAVAHSQEPPVEPPVEPPAQQEPAEEPVVLTEEAPRVSWMERFKREVLDQIEVTGFRRLTYHNHTITGDGEAFATTNYGGRGDESFTDFGSVRITGSDIYGGLSFRANFTDSRLADPQAQQYMVEWDGGPFKIGYGDVRGSLLNTNRFASFSKQLRGFTASYESGPLKIKAVRSEVRGEARTIAIPGNNTAGPYFLNSSQLVRGSEQVEVDGVPQALGDDYVIDYQIGTITFVDARTLEPRIIPPTSTIVATYEALSFGGSKGTVEGVGLSYDMGAWGRIGLTGLRQSTGASGGLGTRLEKFFGFGPPSTPYVLDFEALRTEPVVVRVDGILQTEGVDFRFDPLNDAIIYFNRFMPPTAEIDILYTPKPRNTVNGDRETWGIDYTVPLGDRGFINLSQATGRLLNTPTPLEGTARGASLAYTDGPFTFSGTLTQVPDTFVSIETVGFNRNEESAVWRAQMKPSEALNYGLSHSNRSISVRRVDGQGNVTFDRTRFTDLSGTVEWTPSDGAPIDLRHSHVASRNSTGETVYDVTRLSTSKSWGRLTTRWEASNLFGSSPGVQQSDPRRNVSLQTLGVTSSYSAGPEWSFSLNSALSNVKSESGSGLGYDLGFTTTYGEPGADFSASLTFQDSKAGEQATLNSFSSGYGLGYGGNGFSSGATGPALGGNSDYRYANLSLLWRASERLSSDAYVRMDRTTGAISANTETLSFGIGSTLDLGGNNVVRARLYHSDTEFIEQPLSSASTGLTFDFAGSPRGPWAYNTYVTMNLNGGTSQFQQDSFSYGFDVSHRLDERQSISLFGLFGQTQGYLPQTDIDMALSYRYELIPGVHLNISYRYRDVSNDDPLLASGAYSSNGFDIGLLVNFGQ